MKKLSKKNYTEADRYETRLRNVLYNAGLTIWDLSFLDPDEFKKFRRVGVGLFDYTCNRMKGLGIEWGSFTRDDVFSLIGKRDLKKSDVLSDRKIETPISVVEDTPLPKIKPVSEYDWESFQYESYRREAALRIYLANMPHNNCSIQIAADIAVREADELIKCLKEKR